MDNQINVQHHNVLDNTPFGVIQVDKGGGIIYANKSALKLLEVSKSESLIGAHYESYDWTQFDENEKPLKASDHALYEALKKEKVVTSKIQGIDIGGKTRWFSINASPVYDDKQLVGAVSHFADITQKVEEEKKQKEEAARYKILVENINGVVWETEVGTDTFSYVSPKAKQLLGFPKTEWFTPKFWQSRIHAEDKERVISYEESKVKDVDNYQLEYRMVRKDGKLIWVRDLVEVVKDNNKPVKLRGITLDITESKTSRIQLRETKQRYQRMISEAPYAITIYDAKGLLVAANAKCEDYWLVNLKEYIGEFNIFENDIFTKESQLEEIKRAFEGKSGELTAPVELTHAKIKKHFRIKYYPLFDAENTLENVIYITEDITEYVETSEQIQKEESLKQGILDALDEAILVIDSEGNVINVNEKLKTYIRKQPYSDLKIGTSLFNFIQYLDKDDYLKNGLRSILNEEIKVIEHELKMADGKWYNLRATCLEEPFGAVITWQNINTRKEIEMALEKSLRKYRNIYNKAPVMMHSINEKLEIISVSDYWLEKMGYERNEVIGKTPIDFLSEDSMRSIATNLKNLFSEGYVRNVAYKYRKKNGEEIDVLLSAVAEYDDDGKFERSITGMLDVTDLKRAERKLQDSQFKLLESQRISKIANYEYEVATGYFEPSEEMISMMGLSKSDRQLSVIEKLIHPEDIDEFARKLERSIKDGKDFFHIYRIIHLKTRKTKWISGRGKMIKNEKGEVVRMIGTVQDISEQKHAEQKIRKLTDRVLLATEIANLGVWEYDREKDEIFWEDQMYNIFPNANEPLQLSELKDYFFDEGQELVHSSLEMIKKGVNFLESEVQIKIVDDVKFLRAFTRVLRDHKGKLKGMVGVVYDITIDKKLQNQLESSLEEKNILIKEVHHRVKNNMQLISSILALKSYELENEKAKAIFEEINDRIKAMAVIHDKLYTFYNVSEINLSEYLNHIANELHIIMSSSNFSIEVISDQIVLDVEKALLIGLMVSEMVGNAVKHGFKKMEKGEIKILFTKKSGEHLLRVINNGEQLTPDVLNKSTGLGISLIKTFAKQLGGIVEVDEENGFKTKF
ncbi:PAS domain-containing sensor histidine kinase [Ekhidna sp.]|uniref:PAS domain-containing sensor histidine kinase n=1 Tax=Ekhidna sp. TaxID=2608089 RepID=UPI003CCB90B4